MKKLRGALALILLSLSAAAPHAVASAPTDSIDSAVATFISSNFKVSLDNALADLARTGVRFDADAVRRLVVEQMSAPYDEAAHRRAVDTIEAAVAAVAAADSDSLLTAAAARPGAVVTPTGLVFETISEGTGASPSPDSTVTLRYRAMLPDGTVVDEIADDAEPMRTRVADLAKGMSEGLTMMRPGGTYRLTLPPALAYGTEGVPGVIPPDCAMQFDVTLLNIE